MKIFWILVVAIPLLSYCDGSKILGIFPSMARSHYIVGSALMKELSTRGHEVTVINPFPQKPPRKNYRDVTNFEVLAAMSKQMKATNFTEMRNLGVFDILALVYNFGLVITNVTLQEDNVKQLISSSEKFDLIIVEMFFSEAMLGFGHLFNAPIIGVSTFGASRQTCDLVGTPEPLSYVPHPFLSFTDHMTLVQRIGNILATSVEKLYKDFVYMPRQEALYEATFPNPKPPLADVIRNVSLVLLNNHFTLNFPRPYVPNMIEVGGMHLNRQTRPLPENIKKFLDNAKYGAIYFSMGSNMKGNMLPASKRNALLKVLGSLKQKVLWKFEDTELPGKTDNILISDWFPQDDILAHPNIRLFITHGGLLSTTEAVYHGVPIIGIPMFGDQYLNMGRAVTAGFGLIVDYNEITEEKLTAALNEMLTNRKYADNMKLISGRYRDQPQTPLETAVFWVEYVLRHKGAPHLRSAGQDLSFWQYHNIDAFAILIGGFVFVIYAFITFIRMICCSRTNRHVDNIKQKRN